MDKSIEFLKELNIKDEYIIVGCSTGGDSMCLLDLLYKNKYKIVCAHVNHNIRSESFDEYEYLENYCKEKNIVFEGITFQKNKSSEANLRKKRYDFYKEIAIKYNTVYIATAHHGDDLIETILMRITRGSSLKGYIGFSKYFKEKEFIFLKPLIFYTKSDLLNYDRINNIKYFNDITNDDDTYTRNRFRHRILPFLKEENKLIHNKFLKFSEELEEINDYIYSISRDEMLNNFKKNVLNLNEFNKLNTVLKKKELEIILSNIYGDNINKINSNHINKIISITNNNDDLSLMIPNEITVIKKGNKLTFEKYNKSGENLKEFNFIFQKEIEYKDWIIKKVEDDIKDKSNNIIRLDSTKIELPLHIRSRKIGDKISFKEGNNHKKVKKLFIDKKIKIEDRYDWPIVTDNNDIILWIPGLAKSEFDNDINKKYDIILKYIRKEKINEE